MHFVIVKTYHKPTSLIIVQVKEKRVLLMRTMKFSYSLFPIRLSMMNIIHRLNATIENKVTRTHTCASTYPFN